MLLLSIFSMLIVTDCFAAPSFNNTIDGPEICQCVPHQRCRNGEELVRLETLEKSVKCANPGNVCCLYSDISRVKRETVSPPVCGKRNPRGLYSTFGTNANEANFGEFPWMVALLRIKRKQDPDMVSRNYLMYSGGGSLIHPQVVLTAAHCVDGKKPKEMKIRAGEWDPSVTTEPLRHQDRSVKKIIIHESYTKHGLTPTYDYALLILNKPVQLKKHISPICMPNRMISFDPESCLATGWGEIPFNSGPDMLKILKRVTVPIVDRTECANMYSLYNRNKYNLGSSIICAGGINGQDMCNYDSGSPLVCPTQDLEEGVTRYVQVGIVSFGATCGTPVPGGYASVLFVNRWIKEKAAENGFLIN